jgi:hypothetical protein
MVRECFKSQTGIMFYADRLRGIGLDPSMLMPVVKPRPPQLPVDGRKIQSIEDTKSQQYRDDIDMKSEEYEELRDALSPEYDQLALK